jgi:hypothetical protein
MLPTSNAIWDAYITNIILVCSLYKTDEENISDLTAPSVSQSLYSSRGGLISKTTDQTSIKFGPGRGGEGNDTTGKIMK